MSPNLYLATSDWEFKRHDGIHELPHELPNDSRVCLSDKMKPYTFSVSLKFGAYYIKGQCGEFKRKMVLNAFIYFFGILLWFFIIKFISFFDEVSNFCKRILTNQKHELVVSNCQWNLNLES